MDNIKEKNIMLHEFMGFEFTPTKTLFHNGGKPYSPEWLGYHKSWSELIPVISAVQRKLIEEVLGPEDGLFETFEHTVYHIEDAIWENKIDQAYLGVCDLVSYYNEHKKS